MAGSPRMLEGYRVLDFSQFVAGPTCTRLLAEMGAEVIKVELAPYGDRIRADGLKPIDPKFKGTSHSTYYLQHNHSKLSFAIDMKNPRARQLVMAMLPKIDVVVENFAPGVIKRMGFAYEEVKKVNPKIIMCSISMAGQTGRLSSKPGYDFIGQAYAGVTDGIGEEGGPPALTTMAIGDISTGVAAAMAIGLVSLRGDKFRPSRSGSIHPDGGTTGIFHYRDNQYVLLAVTPHQWPQLLKAMKMPRLGEDPRFNSARGRRDNRLELRDEIEKWLSGFATRDEAIAVLDAERVPCAPVLSVNEAVNHPHMNERKTVRWVDDPQLGRVAITSVPVKFSAWPDRDKVHASRLGEDNERVLKELAGVSSEEIRQLYEQGVLVLDKTLSN